MRERDRAPPALIGEPGFDPVIIALTVHALSPWGVALYPAHPRPERSLWPLFLRD